MFSLSRVIRVLKNRGFKNSGFHHKNLIYWESLNQFKLFFSHCRVQRNSIFLFSSLPFSAVKKLILTKLHGCTRCQIRKREIHEFPEEVYTEIPWFDFIKIDFIPEITIIFRRVYHSDQQYLKALFTQAIFVVQVNEIFVVPWAESSFKHVQILGDIAATKSQVVYKCPFEVPIQSVTKIASSCVTKIACVYRALCNK